VAFDGIQERLGQFDRVDTALADLAAQVRTPSCVAQVPVIRPPF
jgi:hypothetical protein